MNLFICCSANENTTKEHLDDSKKVFEKILENNNLVFGVCNSGIMGLAYKIAKKNHRKIIGICPTFYSEWFQKLQCDIEIETTTMIDSTMKIIENSDAIIVMPGGFGTIYELFVSIQTKICEEHNLPIIIYNSCGYYDNLIKFIKDMYQNNYAKESIQSKYKIANNLEELIVLIENIK